MDYLRAVNPSIHCSVMILRAPSLSYVISLLLILFVVCECSGLVELFSWFVPFFPFGLFCLHWNLTLVMFSTLCLFHDYELPNR